MDDDKRAALIEMDRVGGLSQPRCKPTKAFQASASIAHQARRAAEYEVNTGEITVDFPAAMSRLRSIIDGRRNGSTTSWPVSMALMNVSRVGTMAAHFGLSRCPPNSRVT